MDVGRYEGVAPSMWAFAAWSWRMSGSCAIYVSKRQLDVEKKLWAYGGKPAQKIAKNMFFFRDIDGSTDLFWRELSHLSPIFFWHRWRNSRFWAIYFELRVCSLFNQHHFIGKMYQIKTCFIGDCNPANQRPRKTWSFQWTCFTCKRTYFTWANFYQSSVDAVDKCVLSTNHCKSFSQLVEFQGSWYQFISISLFAIALYSCPQPVNVPSTTRNKPWNTLEPSVNDPWTTREPPGNHQWTTRESPVNHPWTTRETRVLETQKTGLETRKTDFVPWATRETPVKHPWSIREAPVNDPGTLNEHALRGKWFPSFCRFPISNAVCHSTICMSLWTKSLPR